MSSFITSTTLMFFINNQSKKQVAITSSKVSKKIAIFYRVEVHRQCRKLLEICTLLFVFILMLMLLLLLPTTTNNQIYLNNDLSLAINSFFSSFSLFYFGFSLCSWVELLCYWCLSFHYTCSQFLLLPRATNR